ncbi:MAG: hypothetical protein GC153_13320 [Alphaproteobacteria bacterium]|nr:hypothetical protein [Alphaproteobacteria bacterium]
MDSPDLTFGPLWALAAASAAAIFAAFLIAGIVVRAGVLLDRPNSRSSHRTPTPRSGGVAIFAGWAAGMVVLATASGASEIILPTMKLGLVTAGVLLLGLADDVYAPSPVFKLAGQIAAGVAFVLLFGAPDAAPLPFVGAVPLGGFGALLTVFWIVAFMNAFNFMDGVNGIAAGCGAFALAAIAIVAAFLGAPFWAVTALLLALALLAFLPANFPNARLFMGDNGSQTVGFLFAAIAVGAARDSDGATSLLFAPVATLPFLFDVAFTLVGRIRRGRNIFKAHCEHLYQLLARMGATHAQVTALYVGLTALSTACAVLMLHLTPGAQWIAPAALALAMSAPALRIAARARRLGLFETQAENSADTAEESAPPVGPALASPSAHAAE